MNMAEEIKKENKAKKIVLPVIMAIAGLINGGGAGYFFLMGLKQRISKKIIIIHLMNLSLWKMTSMI